MARTFPLVLSALLTLFALSGCQAQRGKGLLQTLFKPQPLRVGIATDAPPLVTQKNGKASGLELEFARGLAGVLQRPLEVKELPRGALAEALLADKIDIVMAGMSVAEAQRQKLATTEPYLISGQIVLVHLNDFKQFGHGSRNLSSADIRLGVVADSPGDTLLKGLKAKGTVTRFPNGPEGLRALISGKIDVFINDLPANSYYAALFVDRGLTPGVTLLTREPLAWAVRPNNSALRQAANNYLEELIRSGTLETMLARTIPFYRNTAYSPKP
ncbi:MAG: ABC transporter substrate-binding protein [Desulfobulbus sp.]|nr:ABC transporter substrate-binding protein [Desulfobulbus sp.]